VCFSITADTRRRSQTKILFVWPAWPNKTNHRYREINQFIDKHQIFDGYINLVEEGRRDMENHNRRPIIKSKIVHAVQDAIQAIVSNADIILYGSRVRGESKLHSDWDFLVLVSDPPNFELVSQIRDKLYDIELEMDTLISVIIRSKQDWASKTFSKIPFKHEVEREGVRL